MTEDMNARMKYARDILQAEVDYRRARRSGIFQWSSSLLIGIAGGVIALQLNSERALADTQKAILSLAALVLGLYSGIWWDKQRRIGSTLRAEVSKIDEALGIPSKIKPGWLTGKVGGLVALTLLTAAALAAIWVPEGWVR